MYARAVFDCRCTGWWKAFTIRSNPLELSRRVRYKQMVHTTRRGCPEMLFYCGFRGPWDPGKESLPLIPFLKKPAASVVALKADGSHAERRAVIMNLG
jgi:hypothetical protein